MGGINVLQEVEDFLCSMGIHVPQQEEAYKMELAYRRGYEDALRNYTIWKDGEQLVGAMQRPLREVLAEANRCDVPIRY